MAAARVCSTDRRVSPSAKLLSTDSCTRTVIIQFPNSKTISTLVVRRRTTRKNKVIFEPNGSIEIAASLHNAIFIVSWHQRN